MIVVTFYPAFLTGHLAIDLTGIGEQNTHISFYPPNLASRFYFRLHDFKTDGKDITKIVVLPSEEDGGSDISELAIYNWWINVKPDDMAYGLFNNRNCSSVVYRALRMGQLNRNALHYSIPIKKNWWLDSPDNVFHYASALAEKIFENLLKELNDICEFGLKDDFPYMQVMALYIRTRKYNLTELSITLIQPFCLAIKQTLNYMHQAILKNPPPFDITELLTLLNSDDLMTIDIESHFSKLQKIADYIYQSGNGHPGFVVSELFQQTIKNILLTNMQIYLKTNSIHTIANPNKINQVLEMIEKKIDDNKNPHLALIQPGSKVSMRPFSSARL